MVPIKLDKHTNTPVARIRMPDDLPQRAPATPPGAAPVEHMAPAPKRSNFLLFLFIAALCLGLASIAVGVLVILFGGALFFAL